MNDIAFKDYADFTSRWTQVTVRYREDSKEMRFVYANPIAEKALLAGMRDYPDGAIFAKVGLISERDAAFESSIVPSGAKRYQFMVRNKKKYAETDGWGYALFNGNGQTMNGEPHANSMACAACHRLVPERGQVFAQFVNLKPFVEAPLSKAKPPDVALEGIKFSSRSTGNLPARVRRLIPSRFAKVQWLDGPVQKHIFEGTVNEAGPMLARESLRAKTAAVLSSDDGGIFALTYPDEGDKSCAGAGTRTIVFRSIGTNATSAAADETLVKMVSYCQSR